jgi:hypothetical protein
MRPWQERLRLMFKVGTVTGVVVTAFAFGLFLAGNHDPAVVALGVCFALSAAGQSWAERNSADSCSPTPDRSHHRLHVRSGHEDSASGVSATASRSL